MDHEQKPIKCNQETSNLNPYLDELIEYINYKAPRVKWGIPEAIGHLARTYPDKVAKAVPKLLENPKNKSRVVRWCAAFGLSNIAKYNLELQDSLLKKFKQIIEIENKTTESRTST